jgi:predicted GIY-YIG superfamily endonuclease
VVITAPTHFPFVLSLSKDGRKNAWPLNNPIEELEMFWVYLLRCADGSYYTGHTDDLDRRMAQYHAGECEGYVATRLPVALVWSQETTTREEALSAERKIKGWSRKKKEAMTRGDWAEVSALARSKSVRPSTGSGRTDLLLSGVPETGKKKKTN